MGWFCRFRFSDQFSPNWARTCGLLPGYSARRMHQHNEIPILNNMIIPLKICLVSTEVKFRISQTNSPKFPQTGKHCSRLEARQYFLRPDPPLLPRRHLVCVDLSCEFETPKKWYWSLFFRKMNGIWKRLYEFVRFASTNELHLIFQNTKSGFPQTCFHFWKMNPKF